MSVYKSPAIPKHIKENVRISSRWRPMNQAFENLSTEEIITLLRATPIWKELSEQIVLDDSIEKQLEYAYERALLNGLRDNNAAMVRAYQDYRAQRDASRVMSNIQINIVPYRIADASLARIILQAEDEIVEQVEKALSRRKLLGQSIEPAELDLTDTTQRSIQPISDAMTSGAGDALTAEILRKQIEYEAQSTLEHGKPITIEQHNRLHDEH